MGKGSCGNAGAFSVACAAGIKKCRKCPGMSGFAGLMAGRKRDNVILPETNEYRCIFLFSIANGKFFRIISEVCLDRQAES